MNNEEIVSERKRKRLPPKIVRCGDIEFDGLSEKEICNEYEKIKNNVNGSICDPEIEYEFKSVNVEFKYLCSDRIKMKNCISLEIVGVILGSLIGGLLSDKVGRKRIILFAITGSCVFGFLVSFTYGLTDFVIFRCVIGFFNGASLAVLPVYIIEMINKKDRLWILNVITWAPTAVIFSMLAFIAKDWRILARISSGLAIPALILVWFVEESPRWLIQQKKIEKSRESLKKICKINYGKKVNIDEVVDEAIKDELIKHKESIIKNKTSYSFKHLYSTLEFTGYSIALILIFFTGSFSKYGIVYNMENVSGSPYMNVILIGLLRYVMNLSVAFCDVKFKAIGRRHIMITFILGITISTIIIGILNNIGKSIEYGWLIRILQISVVGFTSQFYVVGALCSAELFPTPIRNMANAQLQFFSRIGTVVSPYLFYLPHPYISLCLLTLITATVFYFIIPETKGIPLPENMPSLKSDKENNEELKNMINS
ncbi:Solute carrier family 22 member 15 [Strongyloides ratti]|uniref:Solute carrier family 22 member 15 n=1 Tax=Strongyloides ratti TaxID=34506 RepID=A0A090LJ27_STRRB|nr:Solute carrier family 22 member 15 [Strongyloides ratti]CEF69698.1 Solute carrier family 22 member 15 [Strongyloides ratti]